MSVHLVIEIGKILVWSLIALVPMLLIRYKCFPR